jgi:hypothetical protein
MENDETATIQIRDWKVNPPGWHADEFCLFDA